MDCLNIFVIFAKYIYASNKYLVTFIAVSLYSVYEFQNLFLYNTTCEALKNVRIFS